MTFNPKRFLTIACAATALASCATAQETTEAAAPESGAAPLQAYYSFSTTKASAVVGAFDALVAECGDDIPAEISIYSELFNGPDRTTHTVSFTYPDAAALEKTGEAFRTCPGSAAFYETIYASIKPGSNVLSEGVYGGGDPSADQAFMVFQMSISDEAVYAAAFAEMMEANAASGDLPGSYGVARLINVADGLTHFAYIGAPDVATLLAANKALGADQNAARAAFNDAVADIRKMHNSRITVRVKDYTKE